MEERSTQLETEFVFLDTEVLVREKFDWRSKSFTRLKALVATRHIKLLTTSVTIREVKAKMRETLANASGAVKKYEILLAQLGAPECSTLVSEASAIEKLEALFEAFLQDINVIEVPLEIDIAHIFDDYFGQQPPFSDKKKSEFPDAVVIHSLRNWCKQRLFRTYVVSGDPDIKACCDDILLHVESLSEIVSKATVTARVQSHLLEFVRDNRWLREEILTRMRGRNVAISNRHDVFFRSNIEIEGRVYDASQFNIFELNVLSRFGNLFTCEIQFEINLDIEFEVTFDVSLRASGVIYEAGKTYFESESRVFAFVGEARVQFDYLNSESIEIESLDFDPEIEIELRDLDIYRAVR